MGERVLALNTLLGENLVFAWVEELRLAIVENNNLTIGAVAV